MKIFTEQEIVESGFSVDGFSGIYFLIERGRVVYVGQSRNVFTRLQSHSQSKKFDSIKIIPCSIYKMDSIESIYIHSLRPKLNAKYGDGCMIAPLSFASALRMEDTMPAEILPAPLTEVIEVDKRERHGLDKYIKAIVVTGFFAFMGEIVLFYPLLLNYYVALFFLWTPLLIIASWAVFIIFKLLSFVYKKLAEYVSTSKYGVNNGAM